MAQERRRARRHNQTDPGVTIPSVRARVERLATATLNRGLLSQRTLESLEQASPITTTMTVYPDDHDGAARPNTQGVRDATTAATTNRTSQREDRREPPSQTLQSPPQMPQSLPQTLQSPRPSVQRTAAQPPRPSYANLPSDGELAFYRERLFVQQGAWTRVGSFTAYVATVAYPEAWEAWEGAWMARGAMAAFGMRVRRVLRALTPGLPQRPPAYLADARRLAAVGILLWPERRHLLWPNDSQYALAAEALRDPTVLYALNAPSPIFEGFDLFRASLRSRILEPLRRDFAYADSDFRMPSEPLPVDPVFPQAPPATQQFVLRDRNHRLVAHGQPQQIAPVMPAGVAPWPESREGSPVPTLIDDDGLTVTHAHNVHGRGSLSPTSSSIPSPTSDDSSSDDGYSSDDPLHPHFIDPSLAEQEASDGMDFEFIDINDIVYRDRRTGYVVWGVGWGSRNHVLSEDLRLDPDRAFDQLVNDASGNAESDEN